MAKSRGGKGSVLGVLRRPRAFVRFVRDREAPLLPRVIAVLAVLYVLSPVDAIPDAIPLLGWLDDVGVVALVLAWVSREVARYGEPALAASASAGAGAPAR